MDQPGHLLRLALFCSHIGWETLEIDGSFGGVGLFYVLNYKTWIVEPFNNNLLRAWNFWQGSQKGN